MPRSPAPVISPPANGPTAKPTIKTAPAVAAPAGPRDRTPTRCLNSSPDPRRVPTVRPSDRQRSGLLRQQHRAPFRWPRSPNPANTTARRPSASESAAAEQQTGKQTHRIDAEDRVERGRAEVLAIADRGHQRDEVVGHPAGGQQDAQDRTELEVRAARGRLRPRQHTRRSFDHRVPFLLAVAIRHDHNAWQVIPGRTAIATQLTGRSSQRRRRSSPRRREVVL